MVNGLIISDGLVSKCVSPAHGEDRYFEKSMIGKFYRIGLKGNPIARGYKQNNLKNQH